jgi:threonine dehydrogenase-like Zn-dependent dehydrogenase
LIIGLGGVGLNAVQIAKFKGAGVIIGADLKVDALEAAKRLGVDRAVTADKLVAYMADKGLKPDLVLDCVGAQNSLDLAEHCWTER